MKVKSLSALELAKYEAHLLRLSPQDRHLRFSGFVSEKSIREYIRTIRLLQDAVKVIYDDDLNVVAAIHIILFEDGKCAEIALSVEPHMRGKGLGHELFKSAVKWVRARSVERIYSMCLRDNKPMVKIALSEGMALYHDSLETEAYLEIDRPTLFSIMDELLEEQYGWADFTKKSWRKMMHANDRYLKKSA